MILFALGSLLLGILCGYFLFPPEAVPVMDRLKIGRASCRERV